MFFDKGDYSEHNTFSISELFAHMPMDVLSANFGVPEETFKSIPKKRYTLQTAATSEHWSPRP